MNLLDILIYTIGFIAVMWWLFGVILFAFFTNIYVAKGTPLSVKLVSVLLSGFTIPYMLFTMGKLPNGAIIAPAEPSPEEQEAIQDWMKQVNPCNCPECRRQRGE